MKDWLNFLRFYAYKLRNESYLFSVLQLKHSVEQRCTHYISQVCVHSNRMLCNLFFFFLQENKSMNEAGTGCVCSRSAYSFTLCTCHFDINFLLSHFCSKLNFYPAPVCYPVNKCNIVLSQQYLLFPIYVL